MNRGLSQGVSDKWTWVTMLQQCIDHERVASQDGLVQCQLRATVYLRSLFLHDHVKNAEVEVARVLEKLNDEIFLVEQDVDIVALKLQELAHGLDVRVLTSQVKRSGQKLDMSFFVFLVLLVVFELMNTAINGLD